MKLLLLTSIGKRFRSEKRKKDNKQRKKKWVKQQRIFINEAKQNRSDQIVINLCNLEVSDSVKCFTKQSTFTCTFSK